MRVTEETAWLTLRQSEGRSEGLHLSEIIRDYALAGGVLDAKWIKTDLIEEQNTNLMQLGLAFEQYLEYSRQHPEIEMHPGELMTRHTEYCGECGHREHVGYGCDYCGCIESKPLVIYMTPDGLSLINKRDYVLTSAHFIHEFKFTLKSSRGFIEHLRTRSKKSLMWLWQILGYCHAAKTLAAKLHVMFVAGDYSYSDSDEARAAYKIYRLEFRQEDVDQNWEMLVKHSLNMIQKRRLNAQRIKRLSK
jgi:hypothetical protein